MSARKYNMMKAFLLVFALLSYVSMAWAQAPVGRPSGAVSGSAQSTENIPAGKGQISGKVLDASTNEPVPYATIALFLQEADKPINGTVGDDKGEFKIKGIAAGSYKLTVSFIGYETLERAAIEITDKGENVDLGTMKLASATTQLDEVVVQGQRALIEEKVDRTIYNAENDETTKGGDATDVLRRVPLLSVDLDGNVTLRGSQNIRVLIDNKPSTITANSVGDALKQIPADQIKSVEVITSPSAKYDAEGTGGIINIITKKNNLQGAALNINTGVGLRGTNLGLNANLRRGKMGFSLGGFGRAGYNINGSFINTQRVLDANGEILTTQEADTRTNMLFGRYRLGWDYTINKYNWVSATVSYGTRNMRNHQNDLWTNSYQNDVLLSSSLREVDVSDLSGTVDVSLNFTRTFEKPQQEFSILTLYSRNSRTNDFVNSILDQNTNDFLNGIKNENQSYNEEFTVQADYQAPIGDGKSQMMEFGGKNITRFVSSDYQYFTSSEADGSYIPVENTQLTNVFHYQQNISAGYLSYTLNFLKDYSLKAGTRYEYTTIDANFQDEREVEIPSYGVLVPSVNLSRKLKNGNMVKAAYNRRIQRPSLQFLNPNIQAANPLNITQGNPDLEPEYTNNYELSYSTFLKNVTLNFSGFVRNTTGAIQPLRSVLGQDTIYTTYENIGKEDAYGFSVFTNIDISKKFTLNGGIDTYYAVLDNNDPDPLYNASNEGWVISGRMFGNYQFADTWGLQFFGFARGRQVQLQGYQGSFAFYSLNIKKDFNDKKGSIGIGADNFLTTAFKIRSEVVSPTITQHSTNVMNNMSFKINFSYQIGKLDVNPQSRRRKSIQNNDLKEGEDNNQPMNQ